MVLKTLVAVFVRIAGIAIVLYAIQSGGAYLAAWMIGSQRVNSWVLIVPPLLMLIAGSLLIFSPEAVTDRLLPYRSAEKSERPVTFDDLAAAASLLVGLYFLIDGLLDAAYWFSLYRMSVNMSVTFPWNPQTVSTMLHGGLKVIAGLWLVFGARGLIGLVKRARSAGTSD